jgi:hypothetical protein
MFARTPAAASARPIALDAYCLGECVANGAGDDAADDQRLEADSAQEPEPEGADSQPHGQNEHDQRRELPPPLVSHCARSYSEHHSPPERRALGGGGDLGSCSLASIKLLRSIRTFNSGPTRPERWT